MRACVCLCNPRFPQSVLAFPGNVGRLNYPNDIQLRQSRVSQPEIVYNVLANAWVYLIHNNIDGWQF